MPMMRRSKTLESTPAEYLPPRREFRRQSAPYPFRDGRLGGIGIAPPSGSCLLRNWASFTHPA